MGWDEGKRRNRGDVEGQQSAKALRQIRRYADKANGETRRKLPIWHVLKRQLHNMRISGILNIPSPSQYANIQKNPPAIAGTAAETRRHAQCRPPIGRPRRRLGH